MTLTGIEEDKGLTEFFKKWQDDGHTPLGLCEECHIRGPAHRYTNKETGEQKTLCTQCVWWYVELIAEYLKMEEVL